MNHHIHIPPRWWALGLFAWGCVATLAIAGICAWASEVRQ